MPCPIHCRAQNQSSNRERRSQHQNSQSASKLLRAEGMIQARPNSSINQDTSSGVSHVLGLSDQKFLQILVIAVVETSSISRLCCSIEFVASAGSIAGFLNLTPLARLPAQAGSAAPISGYDHQNLSAAFNSAAGQRSVCAALVSLVRAADHASPDVSLP